MGPEPGATVKTRLTFTTAPAAIAPASRYGLPAGSAALVTPLALKRVMPAGRLSSTMAEEVRAMPAFAMETVCVQRPVTRLKDGTP